MAGPHEREEREFFNDLAAQPHGEHTPGPPPAAPDPTAQIPTPTVAPPVFAPPPGTFGPSIGQDVRPPHAPLASPPSPTER